MRLINKIIRKDINEEIWDDKILVLIREFLLILCLHLFIRGTSLLAMKQWAAGVGALCFFLIHVAIYCLSYLKNRSLVKYSYTVASISWVVISIVLLGWNCGSQHFLFAVLIFWVVTGDESLKIKVAAGGVLCILRLFLYIYVQSHDPFYPLDLFPSICQQFINTVFVFAALLFLVVSFNRESVLREAKASEKELQEAYQEAERANKAKSNFLARMSHDIRTPINGIVGMVHIMKGQTHEPEAIESGLDKISDLSHQLELLINDVLDMSRIESGKIVLTNEVFNLREKLREVLPAINTLAKERDVVVAGSYYDVKHIFVVSSPIHIQRIMMNILSNAIKYNKVGGTIEFGCRETAIDENHSNYEFVVKDSGIGMSKEFIQEIFEPFSKAKQTLDAQYSGTGLGMAITKELLEMLGGTIEIQSEVGIGTTVIINLPLEIREEMLTEQLEKEQVSLKDKRILLVEDNAINRDVAKFMLEDNGARVDEAVDGQEGVYTFLKSEANTYDVILMDIMMPVMNGLTATREIRNSEHPNAKDIPIVAMSANAYVEDIKECKDAGMNGHIAKPIDPSRLAEEIAKYIS